MEPLYTLEDAARVAQYFCGIQYDESFQPFDGVTARLVDAGHILGKDRVRQIYLVHGESIAAEALRARLSESGLTQVVYPKQGVCVNI
jgi:hypothetical protein